MRFFTVLSPGVRIVSMDNIPEKRNTKMSRKQIPRAKIFVMHVVFSGFLAGRFRAFPIEL